jgi:hypothetical protein
MKIWFEFAGALTPLLHQYKDGFRQIQIKIKNIIKRIHLCFSGDYNEMLSTLD